MGAFDDIIGAPQAGGGPFDDIIGAPPEKSSPIRRYISDPLLSLAKGVVGVPEAAVGVADIATLGRTGKALENIGSVISGKEPSGGGVIRQDWRPSIAEAMPRPEDVGVRFKQAREYLGGLLTPEQQAANKAVEEAQGFLPTAAAMVTNPSTIAHGVIEQIPTVLGGGAVARGLMKAAPGLAPITAGAIGEGLVSAGQNTEQLREESPTGTITPEAAALMAGSGALTGLISRVVSGEAQKRGIQTVEALLAGAKGVPGAPARGWVARGIGGFLTEGVFEELPQSAQEQVAQNLAQGKPWDEGVGAAAAQGAILGGVMGAGANILAGPRGEAVAPPPAPPPRSTPPAAPAAAPTPSERMGIDPGAGPVSNAAATALDTGATEIVNAARQAEAEVARQPPEGEAAPTPAGAPVAQPAATPDSFESAEEAQAKATELAAKTGFEHVVEPNPKASGQFVVMPTDRPAPAPQLTAEEQAKAAADTLKADEQAFRPRIDAFKAEAKAIKEGFKADNVPLPALHRALSAVAGENWDPGAVTRAMTIALKEKRSDLVQAILERADLNARKLEAQRPSATPGTPLYGIIEKGLQEKAAKARAHADRLLTMSGLKPKEAPNAVQVTSPGGVLPRESGGARGAGSERGRVGSLVAGPAPAEASQESKGRPSAPAAPVVGPGEVVASNQANVPPAQAPVQQVAPKSSQERIAEQRAKKSADRASAVTLIGERGSTYHFRPDEGTTVRVTQGGVQFQRMQARFLAPDQIGQVLAFRKQTENAEGPYRSEFKGDSVVINKGGMTAEFMVQREPYVGSHPVEIDPYGDIHVGSKITSISTAEPQTQVAPQAAKPATESAGELEDGSVAYVEKAIAEGVSNATLIPTYGPRDDASMAKAIDDYEKQLLSAGWASDGTKHGFTKNGATLFLRSQGALSSPIVQWKAAPVAAPDKKEAGQATESGAKKKDSEGAPQTKTTQPFAKKPEQTKPPSPEEAMATLVEHSVAEVDDNGEPTGRMATVQVPAKEAIRDIKNDLVKMRAMLKCLES